MAIAQRKKLYQNAIQQLLKITFDDILMIFVAGVVDFVKKKTEV